MTKDSKPLSAAELTRRVFILEGALGLDLSTAPDCSGEPTSCEADPCSEERCPMSDNLVRKLALRYSSVAQASAFLAHLVEVMREKGIIDERLVRTAKLRTRLAEVRSDIRDSESLLTVGAGDTIQQTLTVGLDRLHEEAKRLERELQELSC